MRSMYTMRNRQNSNEQKPIELQNNIEWKRTKKKNIQTLLKKIERKLIEEKEREKKNDGQRKA